MSTYERNFPTGRGLRRFSIDPESEEPFEEMLKGLKERHDNVQRIFNLLDENPLPIHLAASTLGTDVIEARHGLNDSGRTHRVCYGTHPERVQAIEKLLSNSGGGCVVDALTFHIIRRLGLESLVQEVCGPIYMTGSTRELFWLRFHEMIEKERPSLTVYWQEGQCFRQEHSEEDWSAAASVREADLNWIDKNAKIIPAEGATDPSHDLRRINQLIGHNFIDDMLAAQGSGKLLLCQDQVYRQLAERFLSVQGTWLQPLLILAREKGLLSKEDYNEKLMMLIEFGDWFIAIDDGVLYAAATNEEGSAGLFHQVAAQLGGPDADIISHTRVVTSFLDAIWSERPHEARTAKQTSVLLENLLRGRSDWRDIIGFLTWSLQLRNSRSAALDQHILAWLHGHFLLPPTTKTLPLTPLRLS